MEQRLSILTLGVADLERSADFYLNKFGWEKSEQSNENIIFIHLNGIFLSLYPKEKLAEDVGVQSLGEGSKGFTIAFNTRSEQEVDQLFTQFEKEGIHILKKPEKVFWGGYSGYISDPDENLWEIAYNPFINIDAEGNI